MNIVHIVARVKLGVDRAEYAENGDAGYLQIVNEAQREICDLRSWSFMLTKGSHSIPPGGSPQFIHSMKELAGREPITVTGRDGTEWPVEVITREEAVRRTARTLLIPSEISPKSFYVWVNWFDASLPPPLAGSTTINFPGPLNEQLVFNVYAYSYLPDFTVISDSPFQYNSNALMDRFPEMLIAKAKSIALLGINDPLAGDIDGVFQQKFREAVKADSHAQLTGRKLRF